MFLGDQGVGKSSIIDRAILNTYEDIHNVTPAPFSRPSASISTSRIWFEVAKHTVCRCGTLLDSSVIGAWSLPILKTPTAQSLCTMSRVQTPSLTSRCGIKCSESTRRHLVCWSATRLTSPKHGIVLLIKQSYKVIGDQGCTAAGSTLSRDLGEDREEGQLALWWRFRCDNRE